MFQEDRTTAMAAYFLGRSASRRLNDLMLMKMLYTADRESLRRYSSSISGSKYFSLPKGPILSEVLDLINGNIASEIWAEHIGFIKFPNEGVTENTVFLSSEFPPEDYLRKAELSILDGVWRKLSKQHKWDVVALTHLYPEWDRRAKDENTRYPLSLEDIFVKGFKDSPSLAESKVEDIEYYQALQKHGRKAS